MVCDRDGRHMRNTVGFQVLKAAKIKNTVLRVDAGRSLVEIDRHFKCDACLHVTALMMEVRS